MLLQRGGGLVYESREVDRVALWGQKRMFTAPNRVERRNPPFHITLLTRQEISSIRAALLSDTLCHMRTKRCARRAFFPIGLSCSDDRSVWWMSVWWEWGRLLRKLLEVQSKDFHITLTQMDNIVEDPYRGIDSVIQFVTIYESSVAIEIAHGIIQDAVTRKATALAAKSSILVAALRNKDDPTVEVVMQNEDIAQTEKLFGPRFQLHQSYKTGDTATRSDGHQSSSSSMELLRDTIGLARFATSADINLCESERFALLFHLATRMNRFPSLAMLAHSNCLRLIPHPKAIPAQTRTWEHLYDDGDGNDSSCSSSTLPSGPERRSQCNDLVERSCDEFFKVALSTSLKYFWLPLFSFDAERKILAGTFVLPTPKSILDSVECLYILPPLMLRADAHFIADAGIEISLFANALPKAQISRLVGCLEEDMIRPPRFEEDRSSITTDRGPTTDLSSEVVIFDGKSKQFLVCPPRLAWIVPWKMAYACCPKAEFESELKFIDQYRRALEVADIEQICFLTDQIVVWDLRSSSRIEHPDIGANIVLVESN